MRRAVPRAAHLISRLSVGALLAGASVAGVSVTGVAAHAATPASFGTGSPGFVTSTPDSQLSGSGNFFLNAANAGEPSIGVNWLTGAGLFQANSSTYKLTFANSTNPPTVTWSDVSAPSAQLNIDPILATDSSTGVTIAGGDTGPCADLARTTNDGGLWTPTLPCPVMADHPTVGLGPISGSPLVPVATTKRAAYFCQQSMVSIIASECSRSLDSGVTWSPAVPTSACIFQFGHVKVAPNGTAYVPAKNCTDSSGVSGVGGFKSVDNGLTWTGYVVTGAAPSTAGFDPSIGITTDGTVYESWTQTGTFHPVVASSADGGAHWGPTLDLAGTVNPPLQAATFQAVVAGDPGRLAIAYLGSTVPVPAGTSPFAAGYHGIWNLYVSTSYDGGRTWTTTQASADPVQRGEIDAGGTTTAGQRNLLDFMDASVTKDGRVVVAYADGCLASTGCAGSGGTEAESTSSFATVAYQSVGKGLFVIGDTGP